MSDRLRLPKRRGYSRCARAPTSHLQDLCRTAVGFSMAIYELIIECIWHSHSDLPRKQGDGHGVHKLS